ncbi:uncharacterized protein LOC127253491 isoform X1 [Andrographis paniculata]|uniref:uncharacterized protein LOC127253491 isoform X1 n=1 Tax=Andrographis paniculata TaxID=175694 RepID=UPI0021E760BD|nr:uncharacterized protein LOC127253491 isoform X1 [Andrographis paniculata]
MEGDVEDDANARRTHRSPLKALPNNPRWKQKLRENCFRRTRENRSRLLWKFRLPGAEDQSASHEEDVKSALSGIFSEELKKMKGSSFDGSAAPMSKSVDDDMIWEYDGPHTACPSDCEEILLEMQRIFYEELRDEETRKENFIRTWEDEEDEYLSRAVYEHMHLNGDKVAEVVWCPICKHGELYENSCDIYCTRCHLRLERGDEVDLNLLRLRLAEAHTEHLDRGCRLKPEFCLETKFDLSALYIKCQGCNTLEIVI